MTTAKSALTLALITCLSTGAATAQQGGQGQGQGRPPAPDLAGLAQDLGVSEQALMTCLPRPERGQRPTRPDASALASCLSQSNAALTAAKVDAALAANAPSRPPRG